LLTREGYLVGTNSEFPLESSITELSSFSELVFSSEFSETIVIILTSALSSYIASRSSSQEIVILSPSESLYNN
jgi:hypothetical protein